MNFSKDEADFLTKYYTQKVPAIRTVDEIIDRQEKLGLIPKRPWYIKLKMNFKKKLRKIFKKLIG